jgi:hypothetical protein
MARARRIDRARLLASLALAFGLALVVYGVLDAVTGREQSRLPPQIERIQPAAGDRVLNQAPVVVDLADGYAGRLEVDGVAYPTVSTQIAEPTGAGADAAAAPTAVETGPDSVRVDAGTNTLTYQPRPGGTVERFEIGRHIVRVVYWRLVDGEAVSRSYTWYFDVTV